MPHSAARIWALFQDYDRWTDYAPMVKRVDVLYPGDEHHNGRLRRVIYKMPFGREGSALELVTDVEPERGYTYTMISRTPGDDQIGHVRLEPLGPNRTRFSFDERYNLTKAPWKWFEGPIYKFINKNNEDSMRRASAWLEAHPEYRPDLVDLSPASGSEPDRGEPAHTASARKWGMTFSPHRRIVSSCWAWVSVPIWIRHITLSTPASARRCT